MASQLTCTFDGWVVVCLVLSSFDFSFGFVFPKVYGHHTIHTNNQLLTHLSLYNNRYAMASVPEPIEADELLGRKVIKVASGGSHAVCITEGGEVFQWGMTLFLEPVRVSELLHTKIVDVACGEDYSLALDDKGQLYSWGKGKTGVLGQGSVTKLNQAQLIEALEDKKITSMSAGWQHVACFTEDP